MSSKSLLGQTKKNALKWTTVTAFITVLFSASLFIVLFYEDAERDMLLTANATISSYRSDIMSGDIRAIELQLKQNFSKDDSDVFIFLDSNRQPWVGDLKTINLHPCSNANGICRDLIDRKLIVERPIYFDNDKTNLWGFLHIEKSPNVHWTIIFYVSTAILLGILLLSYILCSQFIKSVKLVSTTMENWSEHLRKNPKDSKLFENAPFNEVAPIAQSLAGLNKEITTLEKAAQEQGSLNTLRSIGHDILNPVSRIKRMVGVLQMQAKDSAGIDPNIFNNLNSNLGRLSSYAEQIKSLYKKNTGEAIPETGVIDISKELITLSRDISQDSDVLNKKISIEVDLTQNCYVNVPAPVLSRIAENLILNSVHASDENSTVRIKVFSGEQQVNLHISDEGAGIPENIKEKIFDPNFTTKINKGTGLGLFVVKQLCEEYRGTIKFTSILGKGTTFELTFPLAETSL